MLLHIWYNIILSNKHIYNHKYYHMRHVCYGIMVLDPILLYYGYYNRLEVLEYVVYCPHMVCSGISRWYQTHSRCYTHNRW